MSDVGPGGSGMGMLLDANAPSRPSWRSGMGERAGLFKGGWERHLGKAIIDFH